jgi:hypothetical protein
MLILIASIIAVPLVFLRASTFQNTARPDLHTCQGFRLRSSWESLDCNRHQLAYIWVVMPARSFRRLSGGIASAS